MKRVNSGIILAFLLISLLPLTLNVQLSKSVETMTTNVSPLGGFWAETDWNKTYGGSGDEEAYSVVQTIDGGYALAGYTTSGVGGGSDFWLVKVNSAGIMEWSKTYTGGFWSWDRAHSMIQTSDGGYALAGYSGTYEGSPHDFWLVKTDANGTKLWDKKYGGTNYDRARSVVQTSDGGYALAGYTNSFGAGNYDFLLVKTDSAGNAQWNKTYGGTLEDIAWSVVQTSDGGYALAGETYSFSAGERDFWLVKTDAAGSVQWNRTYGGTGDDGAWSVVQTSDGGYAIAGYSGSYTVGWYDFWLVKTDAAGNMFWSKSYGGSSDSEAAHSVVQTSDGGYAVAGYTNSFGAGATDFWLVKTDSAGGMQWNKTYGRTDAEEAWSVAPTNDGGYALAGFTNSYGSGGYDSLLVKLTPRSIYIHADGSIDPDSAPIQRNGDLYTLTDNIYTSVTYGIVVERNNVILDGAGYTAQGQGSGIGFYLSGRNNVTIQNTNIKNFGYGIYLSSSSFNLICRNTVTDNNYGIDLYTSSSNILSENTITHSSSSGILIYSSSCNNTVSRNDITTCSYNGIYLQSSSNYNSIFRNSMTANGYSGIALSLSSDNKIFHNNFLNNTYQAYTYQSSNVWDDGYPSGGNYWSDYSGTDLYRGQNQTVAGSDGIGDTYYNIGGNQADRYPLMGSVGSSTASGENVTVFPTDDVCVTFEEIVVNGSTTAHKNETGPDPPTGYIIEQYYEIETTADYSGTIRIRITYDDSGMTEEEEADLKLMQYGYLLGDLDGDFDVDIFDAVKLLVRYGAREGEPDYYPDCDIDRDGRIFLFDAVILCSHYGQDLTSTQGWADITVQIDTENNLIFAETTHLSIFGVTRHS